jgi:hypothetical protein
MGFEISEGTSGDCTEIATAGADIVAGHVTRGGKAMIATLRWRLIAVPSRLIRHDTACSPRSSPGCALSLPRPDHPARTAPTRNPEPRTPRDTRVTGHSRALKTTPSKSASGVTTKAERYSRIRVRARRDWARTVTK